MDDRGVGPQPELQGDEKENQGGKHWGETSHNQMDYVIIQHNGIPLSLQLGLRANHPRGPACVQSWSPVMATRRWSCRRSGPRRRKNTLSLEKTSRSTLHARCVPSKVLSVL